MKKKKIIKREDFWKPFNESMYDCCWCGNDCLCPCARNKIHIKNSKEKYLTVSLLGEHCKHYVPYKETCKIQIQIPKIDPCHPNKEDGSIVVREVTLTDDDIALLLDAVYEYEAQDTKKLCKKLKKVFE